MDENNKDKDMPLKPEPGDEQTAEHPERQELNDEQTEQTDGDGQPAEEKKKKGGIIRRVLYTALICLVLVFAAMVVRQYVFFPEKYEAPPTPQITPEPEVQATPEPTPYVKRVPVKMYFTQREISFPIETVGIVPYTDNDGNEVKNENGETVYTMGTLDSEKAAAWLEESASPGDYGNAIFNGHVSWKKVAGVFSVLSKMEKNEEIIVEFDDGSTRQFYVDAVEIFGIDDVPDYVMAFDTGDSRMTLITCYGESWNSNLGTRNQRCIVIAKPVTEGC